MNLLSTDLFKFMKMKIEGGSGGKRGHSNMTHWTGTEEIKAVTKRLRRAESKLVIRQQVAELAVERKKFV